MSTKMSTKRTATSTEKDYQAIQALVVENPDLERLELLLDQFNMFEAIGAIWQESRHSDLLAFLLDPQRNHRLGETFARKLLQKAVVSAYEATVPVTPIDLDVWDLGQLVVLRDSQRIDILLLDERHRLAVIIANRLVDRSTQVQLQRYWETVAHSHPGWDIMGIYLTPDGEPAKDERFVSLDYGDICNILDRLIDSREQDVQVDVGTMVLHYTEMVRRHIVGESEIARLCRRIYGKHQRAFDLIYEHRISRQKAIRNIIKLLIEQRQGLILDHSQERFTGFAVQEWEVPVLLAGRGDRPGRNLLFQFDTWQDTLPLRLYIGSGSQQLRSQLLDVATAHQPPFKVQEPVSADKEWVPIFKRTFLLAEFYEEASADQLADKILANWSDFLREDLPKMQLVLRKQAWIWEGAKGV